MSRKLLSPKDVRAVLNEAIKEAGNASTWAFENCYSKAYVSYVVNGHKPPSKRMLDDLGLKEVKMYAKKEEGNVQSD